MHGRADRMRRSLALAFAVISALIVFSTNLAHSQGATYGGIGVRVGDWVDYSVSYYSTSPSFPESQYSSDSYNRVHIEVSGVVGTNVTLLVTYFYPDNTTLSQMRSRDVSKSLIGYLILPGLGAGDPVSIEDNFYGELTVNETLNMTILGAQRSVNIVVASRALDAEEILYFDQATGILVESHSSSLWFGWRVERISSTSILLTSRVDPVIGAVTVVASLAITVMIMTAFAVMDRRRRD
jgi:hypothetical protein